MKKLILTLLLLTVCPIKAAADNTVKIPPNLFNEAGKMADSFVDLNILERIMLKQLVKNSSINGVKLKNYKTDSLIDYFVESGLFEKASSNKIIEPFTGAVFEFNSDGKCYDDECTITIGFDGGEEQNPNKNSEEKTKIILRRDGKGGVDLCFPD